jgi:hypothetical protein
LAAPDDFIPALPDWKERSRFIATEGRIEFRHYDFYAQALAKVERGHVQDVADVQAMFKQGLISAPQLRTLFEAIRPHFDRYPAVDVDSLAGNLEETLRRRRIPVADARVSGLPGADLVEQGLVDLCNGKLSIEALLAAIGSPRLRRLGFELPAERIPPRPEHALYGLLAAEDERTAHSRYNALIRRLVSFERAAEFERARAGRAQAGRR